MTAAVNAVIAVVTATAVDLAASAVVAVSAPVLLVISSNSRLLPQPRRQLLPPSKFSQ